jgi:hypothetical protein
MIQLDAPGKTTLSEETQLRGHELIELSEHQQRALIEKDIIGGKVPLSARDA